MKIFLAIIISVIFYFLSHLDPFDFLPLLMFVVIPFAINYFLFNNKKKAFSFLIFSVTIFVVSSVVLIPMMFDLPSIELITGPFLNDYTILIVGGLSVIFLIPSVIYTMRAQRTPSDTAV